MIREDGKAEQLVDKRDIESLDENSKKFIETLADSCKRAFELWSAVYPKRNSSADPIVNARVEQELSEIRSKCCSDYKQLVGFSEKIGKMLKGYSAFETLCSADSPS
jgi:hypothetical protein